MMPTGREQPVRAVCDGVPVYGFGYTYVLGVSPDLVSGAPLQEGNGAAVTKIRPKKSWEIHSNRIGATSPRVPRSPLNDPQPQLAIRLIDDDPETFWCSRPQAKPDVEPVWIRLDLVRECLIDSVVIVPRDDNKGMPSNLTIKVSRDAWHWDTVYENGSYSVPDDTTPRVFSFPPVRAKQVWIVATDLPAVYFNTHSFSVAGVQVIDGRGDNVALASRGTGVTVSSTHYGAMNERELHEMLWPTHYDLGLKWVRVAFWGSVLNWHFVEQEKGKYEVDPRGDEVITECVENGVEVDLCLGFTNWLYTPNGRDPRQAKQIWETQEGWYGSLPGTHGTLPPASTAGMLDGYKDFVRFMTRHFRDRVRYFEIWNEEKIYFETPEAYCEWVKAAAPIIRQEAPDAKIVLGALTPGRSGGIDRPFLTSCLKAGVGEIVDVIAWHPFYGADPDSAAFRDYPQTVKDMKELARSHGFNGEYHANEYVWYAAYPEGTGVTWRWCSELMKAKYLARLVLTHVGLDVVSYYCDTWQDQATSHDLSLFRNTFSADPVNPQQPQAAYYVLRTLCTVLDEVTPVDVRVQFSAADVEFETVGLRGSGGDVLVAIWVPGRGDEDFSAVRTDILIEGSPCTRAIGIDVLNGTEQALRTSATDNGTGLPGMLIRDYPTVVRLSF